MSDMQTMWARIEAITGGHVGVRNNYGDGYTATHNGHHGDRVGASPLEALCLLAEQIELPASCEDWDKRVRQRGIASRKAFEVYRVELAKLPPDPNALPSEYEIGLGRGRLGDWIQDVVDAGWQISMSPNRVAITRQKNDDSFEGHGTDSIERVFVRAFIDWKQCTELDGSG